MAPRARRSPALEAASSADPTRRDIRRQRGDLTCVFSPASNPRVPNTSATTSARCASTSRRRNEGDAFFCIVDLHSITVDYDPRDLHDRTLDLAALLFAVGLDPDRCTLFCQSHVAAHPEAAWLLSAVTGFGQLGRMTAVQGEGRRQGVPLRRPLHLSRPDGGRHPALPDRHRPDRRRPAPAPRARARRRRAVQLALRRDVHGARAASTRRSARGSWTCRSRRRRCRRRAGRRRARSSYSTTPT